jgi:hypothetical protein
MWSPLMLPQLRSSRIHEKSATRSANYIERSNFTTGSWTSWTLHPSTTADQLNPKSLVWASSRSRNTIAAGMESWYKLAHGERPKLCEWFTVNIPDVIVLVAVARLGAGIVDRIVRRQCMCCIVFSILAHLIRRSSHGVISNKVHVPDSAWPATLISLTRWSSYQFLCCKL